MKISFDLPDDLAARFAMAVPADERDAAFALAVREWLERTTTVSKVLRGKRPVGRPAPLIEKHKKSYNLDQDVIETIAVRAKLQNRSESNIANELLRSTLHLDDK